MLAKVFIVMASFTSSLLVAEITIDIPAIPLPRRATVERLPIIVVVRGLDQLVDINEQDGEEDLWRRLAISLPESDVPNLILARQEEHPEAKYYYQQGERTEQRAEDGSLTVTYTLVIEARRLADFADLLKGKPQSIRVEVSYHRWQSDRYGDAIAVAEQTFSRIDAVPVDAPEGITISARHHRLHIEWQGVETVAYSDDQQRPIAGVVVIVSRDETVSLTDIARQFRPAIDGGDRPLTTGEQCQLSADCQFQCLDNVYLDGDKLANVSGMSASKIVQGNSAIIHGLDAGTTYNVVLQYYPDGIARSSCHQGLPIENFTLLELNNEKKAERDDNRCFIASAAYGANELLEPMYWFRDRILDRYSWGRQFINFYYQHSPAIAQLVIDDSYFRVIVQLLLLIPLLIIFGLQYPLVLPAVVGILLSMRWLDARRNL